MCIDVLSKFAVLVPVRRKETGSGIKGTNHFLKGEYIVESIDEKLDQQPYTLEGNNRPLMRHELLKV